MALKLEVVNYDGTARRNISGGPRAADYVVEDDTQSIFTITPDKAAYVLFDTNSKSDGDPKYNDAAVVNAFPYANIFQDRANGTVHKAGCFGKIQAYGGVFSRSPEQERGVVWMVTQMYPGSNAKNYSNDTLDKRCDALRRALAAAAALPDAPKSFAIPRLGVSCTRQPEQWAAFVDVIKQWAAQNKVRVTITKPIYEKKADGTVTQDRHYAAVSTPPPLPGQVEFQRQLMANGPLPQLPSLTQAPVKPAVPPPPPKFACPITFDASGNAVTNAAAVAANTQLKVKGGGAEEPEKPTKPPAPKTQFLFPLDRIKPPAVPWTASSWFKAHVTDVMTPERQLKLKLLKQGLPEWLQEKLETVMISSTDFVNCSPTFGSKSAYASETRMIKKKLWWMRSESNAFMKWGNDHEEDGIIVTKQAVELGHIVDAAWEAAAATDADGRQYRAYVNHMLDTEWKVATMEGTRPFNVFEKEDEHGINIHSGNLVMATSYDGLFWVVDAATCVGKYVYVEIKCPASMYDTMKPEHFCQVLGSVGILRANGIDVDTILYTVWTRDQTRVWKLPFEADKYKVLEKEVLQTFAKKLLPRFVMRDNGYLKQGEIDIEVSKKRGRDDSDDDNAADAKVQRCDDIIV